MENENKSCSTCVHFDGDYKCWFDGKQKETDHACEKWELYPALEEPNAVD